MTKLPKYLEVPCTEYHRPNGRKTEGFIHLLNSPELNEKFEHMDDYSCRFTMENLNNGAISICIEGVPSSQDDWEDLDMKLVPESHGIDGVRAAFRSMIMSEQWKAWMESIDDANYAQEDENEED